MLKKDFDSFETEKCAHCKIENNGYLSLHTKGDKDRWLGFCGPRCFLGFLAETTLPEEWWISREDALDLAYGDTFFLCEPGPRTFGAQACSSSLVESRFLVAEGCYDSHRFADCEPTFFCSIDCLKHQLVLEKICMDAE